MLRLEGDHGPEHTEHGLLNHGAILLRLQQPQRPGNGLHSADAPLTRLLPDHEVGLEHAVPVGGAVNGEGDGDNAQRREDRQAGRVHLLSLLPGAVEEEEGGGGARGPRRGPAPGGEVGGGGWRVEQQDGASGGGSGRDGGGEEAAARDEAEVGEGPRQEGQRRQRVPAEGVRVVEDDDGRGGRERGRREVRAQADAGWAAAAGVADGAAGRGGGGGGAIAVVGGDRIEVVHRAHWSVAGQMGCFLPTDSKV